MAINGYKVNEVLQYWQNRSILVDRLRSLSTATPTTIAAHNICRGGLAKIFDKNREFQ